MSDPYYPPPLDGVRFGLGKIEDDELPSVVELMADGGKLLVTLALREMPYEDYLQTDHWQRVRVMAFQRWGHRCSVCMEIYGLDIHHLHYRTLGCETYVDVRPLCREHHKIQHEILLHVLHAERERLFGVPVDL